LKFVYISKISFFNLQFPAVLLREHGTALDGRRADQEMQSLGVADSEGYTQALRYGRKSKGSQDKDIVMGRAVLGR